MRLTNAHREIIQKRLIDYRFNPEKEAIDKEGFEIADALYNRLYSARTQSRINALSKGWLPEDDGIYLKTTGHGSHHFYFGAFEHGTRPSRRFRNVDGFSVDILDANDELIQRALRHAQREKKYRNQRREMERETAITLSQFTTLKRLIEGFPGIEPHIPEEVYKMQNLPMVQATDLAEKLHLIQRAA